MENRSQKTGSKLSFSSIDGASLLARETVATNLILGDPAPNGNDMAEVKLGKTPKRVLHFCDGTIEEYSSDEDDETDGKSAAIANAVDPKTLTWGPWFWHHTVMVGSTSLKVCDYLGESLASFFGITTPKYQYEIEEYKRMIAEEEELKTRHDMEMGGWTKEVQQSGEGGEAIQLPPTASAQRDVTVAFQPPTHSDYRDSAYKTHERY